MQKSSEFWKALDDLVENSEIVIDRPKGTKHPKYPDFIYRVDYGYLKNTTYMDGAGIDVWVGSGDKIIDAIMCIIDLMKRDSEIKILIGCTEDEKRIIYQTHNETEYMKGIFGDCRNLSSILFTHSRYLAGSTEMYFFAAARSSSL